MNGSVYSPMASMSSVNDLLTLPPTELLRFREINEEWRGQVSNDIHCQRLAEVHYWLGNSRVLRAAA